MSFELPDLDPAPAEQLLNELIRRVPFVAPDWTDHNESDPGITLLQLLSWAGEALSYQACAIPAETYRNMLRWLLGIAFSRDTAQPYVPPAMADAATMDPAYSALRGVLAQIESQHSLTFAALREAVREFRRSPYLAATAGDIEALALETNALIEAIAAQAEFAALGAQQRAAGTTPFFVGRACVRRRAEATQLFIVSDEQRQYQALDPALLEPNSAAWVLREPAADTSDQWRTLLQQVAGYVCPRALLGQPISVQRAYLTPLQVHCQVKVFARECAGAIAQRVADVVRDCLQPIRADRGPDWDYGVAPDSISLLPAIGRVPGVSAVEELRIEGWRATGLFPPGCRGGELDRRTYAGLPLLRTVGVVVA